MPARLVVAITAVFVSTAAVAQELIEPEKVEGDGAYATAGIGILDVEAGTGVNVPLRLTAVSSAIRTVFSITVFDFGLLQGSERDPRYLTLRDRVTGLQFCVDSVTGRTTSFARCAGDTDVVRSVNADISFVPVETVFVGDKPGLLHAGIGFRLQDPRTVYGIVGMFFPTRSGRSAEVRLSMGKEFISLGFSWGLHVRRLIGIF